MLLPVQPLLRLSPSHGGCGRSHILRDMIEVAQITGLLTKTRLRLGGDPEGPITHTMEMCLCAGSGADHAIEPDRPSLLCLTQTRSIPRRHLLWLARQTQARFLPVQPPPAAVILTVLARRIDAGLDQRDLRTIHFGDEQRDAGLRTQLAQPFPCLLLKQGGPVHFGLLPDGTLWHLDPVMFAHSLDRLPKRLLRAEIHQHPLQRLRIAATLDLRRLNEWAQLLAVASQSIALFGNPYLAVARVPVETFFSLRLTPARASQ